MASVASARTEISRTARIALALGGVLLALGTAEGALRAAHFHFDLVPSLEFGWPDPVALHDVYVPDPDLVWVPRGYRDTLRAARRSHPAVVFMGDSCTEFGTYPAKTLAAIGAADPSLSTGVALGVGGWTSAQGLAQLRRDVIPLHPKAITVYYGWNDHWKALGLTDPEIMRTRHLRALAEYFRLVQLWLRVESGLAARRVPSPNRVPVLDYQTNLRSIAIEARAAGIETILVTAPSNHVPGHEPVYLAKRHVRSLAELVPLHTDYMEATRTAAAATGTPLCDAAAAFAALPEPHQRYFQKDGIHLTDAGDAEMARVLSGCLARLR